MKHNRIFQIAGAAALFFALLVIISSPAMTVGIKYKTSGVFEDRSSGQHSWSINEAHTLTWDSQPYIPVGAVFVSKYLSEASDASFKTDTLALEKLKSKEITDVILKAGKPITSCDPAALQKIIDYLDENGFCYGLELDDGPQETLSGYVISPNRYRMEGPVEGNIFSYDWPGVDSAVFVVVDKISSEIREQGGAVVRSGKVTIKLNEPLGSTSVLLVYPHKALSDQNGAVRDLWTGFGEYRDRLLTYFKGVKFGSGLRFFMEPFTSKMDLDGELASFVPDSAGFRLGFEAYLLKKFGHIGSLNSGWSMLDQLPNAETAARAIPFWGSGCGVSYLYDSASAKLYSLDLSACSFRRDLIDYRDLSTQEYMNTIADILKKSVANVPVVFENNKYHRIYANPFGMGGYDGLGVVGYGTGEGPVIRVGGGAYSLAEESAKCTWMIVADAQGGEPGSKTPYYSSETAMTGALESFREVGYKGFFVDDLQQDVNAAQMDWLKSFKDKAKRIAPNYKASIVSFPILPPAGGYVKRLDVDTWWLPSLRIGKKTDFGEGLGAYSLTGEDRVYLWSGLGPTTITLRSNNLKLPTLEYGPKGSIVDKRKGYYELKLTENPIVLRRVEFDTLFPVETAKRRMARALDLLPVAEKMGGSVTRIKGFLDNAKSVLENGQISVAYGMITQQLAELHNLVGLDIWLEGENAAIQNFDNASASPGASGGLALVLDTDQKAPMIPYYASYGFDVKSNTSFEIWLAASNLDDSSPASYCLDDAEWTQLTPKNKVDYAPGLCWIRIGASNVFAGKHTIKIRVDGKRPQDGRYYFAIDAIVLSPRGFTPDGVNKPY